MKKFEDILDELITKLRREVFTQYSKALHDLHKDNDRLRRLQARVDNIHSSISDTTNGDHVALSSRQREQNGAHDRSSGDDGKMKHGNCSREALALRDRDTYGDSKTSKPYTCSTYNIRDVREAHEPRDSRSRTFVDIRDDQRLSIRGERRDDERWNGNEYQSSFRDRSRSHKTIPWYPLDGKGSKAKGEHHGGICFFYVLGNCVLDRDCLKRHPAPEECEVVLNKWKTTHCKFGSDCKRFNCVFIHPSRWTVKSS